MFTKNDKIYADAFKYLYNSKMNAVALVADNTDGWQELPLDTNLNIELEALKDEKGNVTGYRAYFANRLFIMHLTALDYASVKAAVVQRRYSMNDQMAIILNREESVDRQIEYLKMQEWREFAATFAKEIQNIAVKG